MKKIRLFFLFSALSGFTEVCLASSEDKSFYDLKINLIDLGIYSKESSTDTHFTNTATLFLNSSLDLDALGADLGKINMQYSLSFLNSDSQLDTTTNWVGGVGSYVGGALGINDISPYQLGALTWDNTWSNDLSTSIGRTNARKYFLYNTCKNIVLCTNPIKGAMGSLPVNYGYWGAYAKYNLNKNFYVHTGVFEVNNDDYVNKKHGLDFSFDKKIGYNQVYGLGFKDENSRAELFYFYNNSDYVNAYTKESYTNVDGIDFRFNHQFENIELPEVFGTYSYINNKNNSYKDYWELGANFNLKNDKNYFSIKFGQSTLNDDYAKLTQTINNNSNKQTTFASIDTSFNVKSIKFSPFAQYIWNPDNFYRSKGEKFDDNLVVGLLTQVKLY